MIEDIIINISRQDSKTSFENDIIATFEHFQQTWNELTPPELAFMELMLAERDAWMVVASSTFRQALLRLDIESGMNEWILDIDQEHDTIPEDIRAVLEDAISWLFWSSSISNVFGWAWERENFLQRYTHIISGFSEDDFLFHLSPSQIELAHRFLRDNNINRRYDIWDLRSNYIIGIIAHEIEERWIDIEIVPSYRRNLASRVLPILEQFDEQWLHPRIWSFLEADEAIEAWNLVLIDSELWTLDNSILSKSWRDGQEWLVYAHPSVLTLMHLIINTLNERGVDYVPNIWSLLRPVPYNASIRWSSPHSPHTRWLWVDFDLGSRDLENILIELDVSWYIVLTIESDHYHITIINPDWLSRDFPDVVPEKIMGNDVDRTYLWNLFWNIFTEQLGENMSEVLLDTLWEKIQGSPLEFIDSEQRLWGNNDFLQELFWEFVSSLSSEQREDLLSNGTTLDIDIFFRVSSGASRRWSRRVYFAEIISPTQYPESDAFSVEIQESRSISDIEFLSFSTDIVIQELFWDIDRLAQVNMQTIEGNIIEFYRFFMHMESDFRNIWNTTSSARWFHQILNGVIWWIENTSLYNTDIWRYTSFQEYLNRVNILLGTTQNSSDYIYGEFYDQHRMAALESNLYSPQALSWSEQSFLVLWSLLHKARTNLALKYQLQRIFLYGDLAALGTIYADYHHTDRSHRATGSRLNNILPTYEEHLTSPSPSLQLMNLSVDTQLDMLIWDASQSETEISWIRAQFLQRFLLMLWYEVSNLEFTGDMVPSFWPSTRWALIQFQIDNDLISWEDSPDAWIFWPRTKRILHENIRAWVEAISGYTDDFIWPPISPGLRVSDIIHVFSR